MAREIRKLGIPVVCTLSGEDIFLEKLIEPFYGQARATLRERATEIDAFVALNHYYADFMADYLAVSRERIHVIPHGLNLAGHGTRRERNDGTFTDRLSGAHLSRQGAAQPDRGRRTAAGRCEFAAVSRPRGRISWPTPTGRIWNSIRQARRGLAHARAYSTMSAS